MKAKRVDSNQKELVKQIRQIPGTRVAHIHTVGQGVPDLLVSFRGFNYLFEVKDGKKSKSEKKLTAPEEKLHDSWTGRIDIVENINDVLKILNEK